MQPQTTQLLVRLYKRRRKRLELSLDLPFPEQAPSSIYVPKNIAKEALRIRVYLNENPESTYAQAAWAFHVTPARISQLAKVTEKLPGSFLARLADSRDPIWLRRFSGKRLLKIASLACPNRIQETIDVLSPKG